MEKQYRVALSKVQLDQLKRLAEKEGRTIKATLERILTKELK